ncbi:MAG: folate-binding protein YgfZ [Myxococcales bacterium]|nr:folate-binding protein YgfZ [Myxococcales bacterium]
MSEHNQTSKYAAELGAIERGALVRPMPELATIEVTGSDRQSWLGGLVTCNLAPLGPGNGAYALMTSKTGRIQAEAWIALDETRALVGVRRDLLAKVREHLEFYLVMEDAEFSVDDSLVWWLAHGPESEAVAAAARALGGVGTMGVLGELTTALMVLPRHAAPSLADSLCRAPGVVLATPMGWDRIRIERMLPRFGVDFEVGCFPQEATLESLAVSFEKGCYVGQEAVFMLEKRGHVQKRLVRLIGSASATPPRAGSEITTSSGESVGKVTSVVTDGERVLAIGMVRYKQTLSGTELLIEGAPFVVSCLDAHAE